MPEACENPESATGIEKIYDEILECKGQEAENPLENEADRNDFRYVFLERLSTI